MSLKPLPIIHLTQPADHVRLVRALHPLGWTYLHNGTPEHSAQDYMEDVGDSAGIRYPYLALDTRGCITMYANLTDPWRQRGYTVVNSIGHFLAYTRSLGPAAEVVDDEDNATDYESDDEFTSIDLDGD